MTKLTLDFEWKNWPSLRLSKMNKKWKENRLYNIINFTVDDPNKVWQIDIN